MTVMAMAETVIYCYWIWWNVLFCYHHLGLFGQIKIPLPPPKKFNLPTVISFNKYTLLSHIFPYLKLIFFEYIFLDLAGWNNGLLRKTTSYGRPLDLIYWNWIWWNGGFPPPTSALLSSSWLGMQRLPIWIFGAELLSWEPSSLAWRLKSSSSSNALFSSRMYNFSSTRLSEAGAQKS